MSVESDLVKGIIKLRADGWQKGIMGNRALGSGPACLVGSVADDYDTTDTLRLLEEVIKEECEVCVTYGDIGAAEVVFRHNDRHLNHIDEAVATLKKALARA